MCIAGPPKPRRLRLPKLSANKIVASITVLPTRPLTTTAITIYYCWQPPHQSGTHPPPQPIRIHVEESVQILDKLVFQCMPKKSLRQTQNSKKVPRVYNEMKKILIHGRYSLDPLLNLYAHVTLYTKFMPSKNY